MCDVSSAQVESALHRQMSPVLDLLCDEFTENDLLGEVLAPDDDVRAPAAGREHGARNTKQNYRGLQPPRLNPARERLAMQALFSSGAKARGAVPASATTISKGRTSP